jgi:hypothetical protein
LSPLTLSDPSKNPRVSCPAKYHRRPNCGDDSGLETPSAERADDCPIQNLTASALDDKDTFDPAGFGIDPHLKRSATSDSGPGPPRLDGIVRMLYRKDDSFHLIVSKRLAMNPSGIECGCRDKSSVPKEQGNRGDKKEGTREHCNGRTTIRHPLVNTKDFRAASRGLPTTRLSRSSRGCAVYLRRVPARRRGEASSCSGMPVSMGLTQSGTAGSVTMSSAIFVSKISSACSDGQ